MQELKDRILSEGEVIGSHILKVGSFLNHQILKACGPVR